MAINISQAFFLLGESKATVWKQKTQCCQECFILYCMHEVSKVWTIQLGCATYLAIFIMHFSISTLSKKSCFQNFTEFPICVFKILFYVLPFWRRLICIDFVYFFLYWRCKTNICSSGTANCSSSRLSYWAVSFLPLFQRF